MEVRDGIPVWGGDAVEVTVVPTRSPISRFLWDHVEGDAQLLLDGRIMPKLSMC